MIEDIKVKVFCTTCNLLAKLNALTYRICLSYSYNSKQFNQSQFPLFSIPVSTILLKIIIQSIATSDLQSSHIT